MSKPTVISLFTGAGGLDLGFEAAGFVTRVAIDNDSACCNTIRQNRPKWPIIEADIRSDHGTSALLLREAGLRPGDPDILIGGPPCQPFSKSGYWVRGDVGRLSDPNAETLDAFLRVLSDVQPKAYLIENVPGLAFDKKDEGLHYLRKSVERINRRLGTRYSFSVSLLRAVEFGVPQDRHRVFIVGARDGTEFIFPTPTHTAPTVMRVQLTDSLDNDDKEGSADLQQYIRSWDAIFDLENDNNPELSLSGKWAELLPSIPEGANYLFHTERGGGKPLFGWRRRYWHFLLKLSKNLPSWTIAASPGPATGPFHWKNRRLSSREMMRLQTFPDSYVIRGNVKAVQKQVGNAVPCLLAEHIALSIRRQFFDPKFRRRSPSLAIERRKTVPPPENALVVPRKFNTLTGTHAAHPGTGKGYAARKR